MKKIATWDKFLLEQSYYIEVEDPYYRDGNLWWGVPQGDDDTGGFSLVLTPLSSPMPEKGTPANVSDLDYDDVNGDCDDFDEGTEEHDECLEIAAERWEESCKSKVYDRIYFILTHYTLPAWSHKKGGIIYKQFQPPLPKTIAGFKKRVEEDSKNSVSLYSTKSDWLKMFIGANFFLHQLYRNRNAVSILKNLENLIEGEDVGLNMLLDDLKNLVDNGARLDYSLIVKIFKEAIPHYEIRMTARGVDIERMNKLIKANNLLKRK